MYEQNCGVLLLVPVGCLDKDQKEFGYYNLWKYEQISVRMLLTFDSLKRI